MPRLFPPDDVVGRVDEAVVVAVGHQVRGAELATPLVVVERIHVAVEVVVAGTECRERERAGQLLKSSYPCWLFTYPGRSRVRIEWL